MVGRLFISIETFCLTTYYKLFIGACSEYAKNNEGETEETRVLGLVMVPGRHIVSLKLDETQSKYYYEE